MKALISIILVVLSIPSALQAQELGDLRWQYHILLLMDPNGNPRCEEQLNSLRAHTTAMQERDLLLFVFNGKALLDQHGEKSPLGVKEIPSPIFEGVILIGKDGGVKLKKPFPVSPEDIFERIDTMVVRKGEKRG
jgi:hypothetical protein